MAAPFIEVMEVKNSLRQQHIIVSDEWIEACIAFVKEVKGVNIPLQNLTKGVYQQWLLADLEKIKCPSLPPELPTVQKTTLTKNFALQVEGIRDISRPAYSQLKQLEGTQNSNAEFSSTRKEAIPEWEAKPTRMLLLNLTDGCTNIQGMEYRSISFLSPNLSPGIKVLIKGPVDCTSGILWLTSDNIRILGGEVESKLQQFSRENILKEQLQIQRDESNEEESANSVSAVSYPETSNSFGISNISSHSGRNHGVGTNAGTSSDARFSSENKQVSGAEDILNNFESGEDDFEQNIDYEMLDEIENSQRPVNQTIDPHSTDDNCDDMWNEDEDMIRELMEFQDQNEAFEMPFEVPSASSSASKNEVFTYLSAIANVPTSNCLITIKGFIMTVLSKLECTPSKGWTLMVKINDGTATVNASLHDKVLENIIGVSAQDMVKKQAEAARNPEVRKEVMQSISNCKLTLQNYNCLMDVKFTPGEQPCIRKCYPVSKLQIQQLLERARCCV